MPCVQSFNARFGGLSEAYRLIGYNPIRNLAFIERDRGLLSVRRHFTATIISKLREMGLTVTQNSRSRLLTLNMTLTVRLTVARCRSFGQSYGWLLRTHSATNPDITVVARLDPGNEQFKDFFCVPQLAIGQLGQEVLRPGSESQFEKYRHEDFSFLGTLVRETGNE